MAKEEQAHRPRARWHDYTRRGIYHITIVNHNRKRVFGELNRDSQHPQVILTKLGQYANDQWLAIPEIQAAKGRKVSLLGHQVMPDHFHGILRVDETLLCSAKRHPNQQL